VVTPNSVYQSVAQLRRALGEDKSSRRFIETVSRRGYRLLAPVVFDDAPAPSAEPVPPSAQARRSLLKPALLVSALGALALAVVVGLQGELRQRAPTAPASEPEQQVRAAIPANAQTAEANARAQLPPSYQGDKSYRNTIAYLEKSLASQADSVGDSDPILVPTLIGLANLYPLISEPLKSESAARRGLAILSKHGKEESSEGVELTATLAEALADIERFAEADRYLTRALALSHRVHGAEHYATVGAIDQFALLRLAEGRFEDAEREARRAVAAYRHVRDATGVREAYLRSTLTWALVEQRRYEDAVREGKLAIDAIRDGEPPAPYLSAVAHHFFGEALVKAGRYSEAEAVLRTELELFGRIPHVAMDGARAESSLAEALMKQGRFDEAAQLLQKASLTLKHGDGWRERKSRRETRERIEQLRLARAGSKPGQLAAVPAPTY
jgi:tetratricopeptide (TPR) repeat protein